MSEIDSTACATVRERLHTTGRGTRELPAQARGLESWRLAGSSSRCQILSGSSPTRVRFASDVRAIVESHLDLVGGDGDEAGCKLYGYASDTLIEVTRVEAPSAGGCDQVYLDFTADHDEDRTDLGDRLVGEVHSHPSGLILPSPQDMSAWATLVRSLGFSTYLGVVAAPTRRGWECAGWIVRFGCTANDVAERASLSR